MRTFTNQKQTINWKEELLANSVGFSLREEIFELYAIQNVNFPNLIISI